MAWLRWLYVVSFFGLVPLEMTTSSCTPMPGLCCDNNNPNANDTTVHSVAVLNCSFESSLCCYRQGCVDSDMTRWNMTQGYATVRQSSSDVGAGVYSILESPWVNVSAPSCVEFTYNRGKPYQLDVFLAFYNGTQPSLMANSSGVGDRQNKTSNFSIECMTGKIQFRVRGGGASSDVSTPMLYYVSITEGRCEGINGLEPSDPSTCEASTTTTTSLSTSTTQNYSSSSTTSSSSTGTPFSTKSSTTSTTPASSKSSSSTLHTLPTSEGSVSSVTSTSNGTFAESPSGADDKDGTNVAAIVGASLAAVTVTAVVIVVVIFVCRRKFYSRKADGDERSFIGRSTPTGDRGYVNIVATGSPTQTTVFSADVTSDDPHPSELAEDGTPGKTRNSLILSEGTSHSSHHHHPNGALDGDYSRVDDVQGPAADSSGKNDAQATQDCKDVYSVVNKPGRKPASPADYSLAKIVDEKPALPNPNDVYSVVNKKGKKPTIAPKPGTSDAEYNTTSQTGRSTTKQGAGDSTADTYNRIGAVPSLGPNRHSPESTIVGTGFAADDYNTLDFADARQTTSRKEKSGAYDHVSNNPDDSGYSKTRIGERNVVIDSEYNHLQA